MGVIETRVKQQNTVRIMDNIGKDWNAQYYYYQAPNGRIWLLVKQYIQMQMIEMRAQFICCKVTNMNTSRSFLLTIVYANNDINERQELWRKLTSIGVQIHREWLLIGDFNNVLSSEN